MTLAIQLIACFFATIMFAILLHQPKNTLLLSGIIATSGYVLFYFLQQTTLAYFISTLMIGIICEITARIKKKAATLFITSCIIPLVPGFGLYQTMRYVVDAEYSLAATTGIATLLGICAMALALTLSSILFINIRHRKPRV